MSYNADKFLAVVHSIIVIHTQSSICPVAWAVQWQISQSAT